ncbi:hypothetical protein SAMN02799630_02786 [Paenibacillus sp. UNCCL117]|uniref:hypothetical protein n=1 Tax=unclassified Paenibacillus TaxID=185978 RepID=UPI00088A3E12|nr:MULTISPECIES: hypothetical protein [unclassified Paenibacillus]SDD27501.1 hypothetical protein SAMN04488602_107126 [Paenibacillus sp. cl123]SFW40527.1 hypothetical protein SAMN02799630_02786 [Paenibacillus sp. UNCCL117]
MLTICNEGCSKQFYISDMPTEILPGGVEKTHFKCPHCQHEYVSFYTDVEIRKLQAKIRDVLKNNGKTTRVEKLRAQIKEKMDTLRSKVERTSV